MTVDVCHAAITPDATHEQVYVAATRGRDGNHLWVTLDGDHDTISDSDDLPDPEQLLSRVLERRDVDRLSAHQVIADSLADMGSLARLGHVLEDAARTATDRWLTDTLTRHGLAHAVDDPAWPSLVTRLRQAALDGHDTETLLDQAIRLRGVDDAHSIAGVLHWRLDTLTQTTPQARQPGPLNSLPPTDGPAISVARQAGELMRQRWRAIRTALAITTEPLPCAPILGARPTDPVEASAWLTAATAITAYRERYEIPDYTPELGPRPSGIRPDARAAFDHARRQSDRYLARRLRHLDDQQLQELDARQAAIIDNPPKFDPLELEQARSVLDARRQAAATTRTTARSPELPDLNHLERAAQAHHEWRTAAAFAQTTRRHIAVEQRRRRTRRGSDRVKTSRAR